MLTFSLTMLLLKDLAIPLFVIVLSLLQFSPSVTFIFTYFLTFQPPSSVSFTNITTPVLFFKLSATFPFLANSQSGINSCSLLHGPVWGHVKKI